MSRLHLVTLTQTLCEFIKGTITTIYVYTQNPNLTYLSPNLT